MEVKVNILDYLPSIITNYREIQSIAIAENPELNELWQMIGDLMKDQFIHDATEKGIKRWEKILNIKPLSSSTLEERRWEILNRINVKIPYTVNMLRNKFNAMYGDRYYIKLINDTYTLKIRIGSEYIKQLESTRSMLNVLVPANLVIELDTY